MRQQLNLSGAQLMDESENELQTRAAVQVKIPDDAAVDVEKCFSRVTIPAESLLEAGAVREIHTEDQDGF